MYDGLESMNKGYVSNETGVSQKSIQDACKWLRSVMSTFLVSPSFPYGLGAPKRRSNDGLSSMQKQTLKRSKSGSKFIHEQFPL